MVQLSSLANLLIYLFSLLQGEPNNDGLAGENCCDFYTGSGKWNDNKCFQVRPYACKQIGKSLLTLLNLNFLSHSK